MGYGHDRYWLANDCPVCGEKDSEGAWKGARMGNTAWGHDYSCCSDKCGYAFFHSKKHQEFEIERLNRAISSLQYELNEIKSWETAA